MSESKQSGPDSLGHKLAETAPSIPTESKSEPPATSDDRCNDGSGGTNCQGDDGKSVASTELSDVCTAVLLELDPPPPPAVEGQVRELGLSAPRWFSGFADYDIITVHGLRDDHSTAWTSKGGDLWLYSRLMGNLSTRQLDYMYATDDAARVFHSDGIEVEARELLRQYAENRRNLEDTELYRPIIWVCHDIGGTIAKQALIEASRATLPEDFDDVETWEYMKEARSRIVTLSTAMISLGCHHKSESVDVLEDEVLNLMSLPGKEIKSGMIRKIKNIARQVDDTNTRFLETKLFSRLALMNIFSLLSVADITDEDKSTDETAPTVDDCDAGENKDQRDDNDASSEKKLTLTDDSSEALTELAVVPSSPFSRYTTTLYCTFEIDSRYRQTQIDHAGLARGDDDVDGNSSWVANFRLRFDAFYYCLQASFELTNSKFALLSLTPPTRLPEVHCEPDRPKKLPFLDWITTNPKFELFNKSVGPYTLCIQGDAEDASRMAMFSQYLYTWYEGEMSDRFDWQDEHKGFAFYFQFDKFDSRYNSIRSMLATFLSQMTSRMWAKPDEGPTASRVFESLEYYRNWSLPHLFNLFTDMRRCKHVQSCAIMLGCLDNCVEEERNWFLTKVLECQSRTDLSYRLVITTSGRDQFLRDSLPGTRVLSLDECAVPLTGYAIDEKEFSANGLKPYLEDVLRKRPVLSHLREGLEEVIGQCRQAPHLGYRILQWLRHFGRGLPIAEIAATVNKLQPVTPQNMLSVFISTLPDDKVKLALSIHRWVKYALEPLTVEALGHALAVSTDSGTSLLDIDYEQLLRDVSMLAGVVVVEGGVVKFSHDSFYETTVPDGNGDENPALVHSFLAEACLKILMHQEVQQSYAKLSIENYGQVRKPLVSARDGLLEYSVRFWADHYRLCESGRPIELVLEFFRSTEIRNKWAGAHYLLSNPYTRIHRSYVSPLPLMAALGLDDVVSRHVEEEGPSRWFQEDAWLAITEAARNSHGDIVQKLLGRVQTLESSLQDAIVWAASSGDEGVLAQLLERVGSLDRFCWPRFLLSRAAAFGLDALVSTLIRAGCDMNEKNDETGETPILTAIAWGHQTTVKLLLDAEVDLSVEDKFGRTPLLLSVDMGQPEIVKMLLDAGATVDVSVVNRAIYVGEHGALERLLAAGPDLSTQGHHGSKEPTEDSSEPQAPLVYAAENHRLQCIRILLDHGADPCIESEGGSPLYLLCNRAHVADTCRLLIDRGAKPNQVYSDKEMLLHRAIRTEDEELVGLLVEKGAELDSVDTYEDASLKTPLTFAIDASSLEMVDFLLEKGASVNYVPEGAESPLFASTFRKSDSDIAELLLKRGADVHWERSDGWTPLHAGYDVPEFVSLLLKHGADVNKMTNYGTVLMMAARWNFINVLKILLAHRPLPKLDVKFDYDPEDSEFGYTALRMAAIGGNHECASVLLEAGAELDDQLKDAKFILEMSKPDDSDAACKMMRDFLDRGTTVHRTDDDNNTALHGISSDTPVQILRTLTDLGAPVDSPNNDGLTPLGIAVQKGNVAAAKYLISRGARADVYGPKFGSFLHLACQVQYGIIEPPDEMFKLLIHARVDPNVVGPEPSREPLLHAALVCDNFTIQAMKKIVHLLVEESSPSAKVNAPGGVRAFPILAAAYGGHSAVVEYLVRRGADVNVADGLGRRSLHFLAAFSRWRHNMRPIRVLTKAGADLQAADRFGRTVLHFAAGANDPQLIEWIMKKLPQGYDVNVRDNDGWTPLMWACMSWSHWNIEPLVNIYGADIWARSADGEWSAMKLACFSDQPEDSKKLLQPPEDERERVDKDGVKQVWDPAFHTIPPSTLAHGGAYCDSCFAILVGPRYKCTVCVVSFDLCFKCFPIRSEVHDSDHELKEFYIDRFEDQQGGESREENGSTADTSEHSSGNKSVGTGTDTDDDDDDDDDDDFDSEADNDD